MGFSVWEGAGGGGDGDSNITNAGSLCVNILIKTCSLCHELVGSAIWSMTLQNPTLPAIKLLDMCPELATSV